jgi:hypothetical protein
MLKDENEPPRMPDGRHRPTSAGQGSDEGSENWGVGCGHQPSPLPRSVGRVLGRTIDISMISAVVLAVIASVFSGPGEQAFALTRQGGTSPALIAVGEKRPCLEHVQTVTADELRRRQSPRGLGSVEPRAGLDSVAGVLLFIWDSASGPRDRSHIAGRIAAGSYGIVLRRVGDDYYVQCPFSKRSGWLKGDLIARTVWLEDQTLRDCAPKRR